MKLFSFAALVRKIGVAIVTILLSIELIIANPLPAVAQPVPAPPVKVTSTPAPTPVTTKKDPPALSAPKQAQAKSDGPYDVKTIQESYRSLYGS